jgi:WD40 repeat protein
MALKWNRQNGNWLISASRDHFCKLFDIRNLKEEVQCFRGHKKEACSKLFLFDYYCFKIKCIDFILFIFNIRIKEIRIRINDKYIFYYCYFFFQINKIINLHSPFFFFFSPMNMFNIMDKSKIQ